MPDADVMETLTNVAQDDGGHSSPAKGDLTITEDRDQGLYEAKIDGETVAGVVYTRSKDHITLLATSVYPQYRGRGIAGQLLGGVLDSVRDAGETVTVSCPFATTYINAHPEYRGVVTVGADGQVHGRRAH